MEKRLTLATFFPTGSKQANCKAWLGTRKGECRELAGERTEREHDRVDTRAASAPQRAWRGRAPVQQLALLCLHPGARGAPGRRKRVGGLLLRPWLCQVCTLPHGCLCFCLGVCGGGLRLALAGSGEKLKALVHAWRSIRVYRDCFTRNQGTFRKCAYLDFTGGPVIETLRL